MARSGRKSALGGPSGDTLNKVAHIRGVSPPHFLLFFPAKPPLEPLVSICSQPPWLQATRADSSPGLLLSNQRPPSNICAEFPRSWRRRANDAGPSEPLLLVGFLKATNIHFTSIIKPLQISIAPVGTPATHTTHIFTSCLCSAAFSPLLPPTRAV